MEINVVLVHIFIAADKYVVWGYIKKIKIL